MSTLSSSPLSSITEITPGAGSLELPAPTQNVVETMAVTPNGAGVTDDIVSELERVRGVDDGANASINNEWGSTTIIDGEWVFIGIAFSAAIAVLVVLWVGSQFVVRAHALTVRAAATKTAAAAAAAAGVQRTKGQTGSRSRPPPPLQAQHNFDMHRPSPVNSIVVGGGGSSTTLAGARGISQSEQLQSFV